MDLPIREKLLSYFSLFEDKADDETIDREIRTGVEMRGANIWVLMFAILIASIGLNMNSAAVIIGAMLISPLMGPIIGIGYGVGTLDFALIRHAAKNLTVAIAIAIATSTLYFWISPLTTAQSELLARTTPSIWDVLIALFGGLAGIVGATRKAKSTVVPGVAIATALMPPLCTAGYGLADGHPDYFAGALYLFTINSVFIALAAGLITRAFHVRLKPQTDKRTSRRIHIYVAAVALFTILPSLYLATGMVQAEVFRNRAEAFVSQNFRLQKTHIIDHRIDAANKTIEITLIGGHIPAEQLSTIRAQLSKSGLKGTRLIVHQTQDFSGDLAFLKQRLSETGKAQDPSSEDKETLVSQLQDALAQEGRQQQKFRNIEKELHILLPSLKKAWLSETYDWDDKAQSPSVLPVPSQVSLEKPLPEKPPQQVYIANLEVSAALSRIERNRITQFLIQRLDGPVEMIVTPMAEPPPKSRRHGKK